MRGEAERLISTSALQFKGSGWYVNDYAKTAPGAKTEGKADSKPEGKSEGTSEIKSNGSKSESKPDSKSPETPDKTESKPAAPVKTSE